MMRSMVAQLSPADELPRLYRATLAGVETLERRGRRSEAAAIRREAIAAYSAAWDDRHRDLLTGLLERVRRECERGQFPVVTGPSVVGRYSGRGRIGRKPVEPRTSVG
jgi:hypothetical protein